MKKLLYYFFIILLIFISLPLQILAAFLIAVTSGFPILFTQWRAGKNGKPFLLYKFRTMVQNADRQKKMLYKYNEANGPVFKIYDDPRFTRFGCLISHIGVDELPQLFNVLLGDMSLFGPRPLPLSEARKLTNFQRQRHAVKPGLLSPWILDGYHRLKFVDWMKSDIAYGKKKSFWYDTTLFFRSVRFMTKLFLNELCCVGKQWK